MAYRRNTLGLLVQLDPAQAREQILAAYRNTGGNEVHAAKELGVGVSSLKRWVAALTTRQHRMSEQIAKMRTAERLGAKRDQVITRKRKIREPANQVEQA